VENGHIRYRHTYRGKYSVSHEETVTNFEYVIYGKQTLKEYGKVEG
jgi:hypothetical protein